MYKDYFIYNFNALPLPIGIMDGAPSSQVFNDYTIRMHSDADFLWLGTSYIATDPRIYIKVRDGATNRYYTDVPAVDARLFCGSLTAIGASNNALFLKKLQTPIQISAGNTLTFEMADFSGASNYARIALHGVKLRNGTSAVDMMKRQYTYQYSFHIPTNVTLSANTTQQLIISNTINSDLYIQSVIAMRTGAFTIGLTTGGVDQSWSDSPIHIDNFAGNAIGYNILPEAKVLMANGSLSLTLTDLSGATNAINLIFEGYKKAF